MDTVTCPRVYVPELPKKHTVISRQKIIQLKGKCSGAVTELREVINSPRWHQAWVKLDPLEYGWFDISSIFWKRG